MICENKTLFGRPACRFEARYDEVREPAIDLLKDIAEIKITGSFPARHQKTYVRDVCVTCGKTIERKP